MVIVKSKITDKFLRQHSGSVNDFKRRIRYKVARNGVFMASLPPKTEWERNWPYKETTKRQKAITLEVHKCMYNADALEARRYASPGSATASVGKWRTEAMKSKYLVEGRVYYLPDDLEIHEIVAGNLCLVSPDDSEELKRKKKEDCK